MTAERKLSTHAHAAKLMRAELKKAFPGIKFSVTSESYSMGDSVNIKWEDGVTTEQVENITDKYQYGHFNGMEDIYEYSNKNADIPQVKYVSCRRELSDEVMNQVAELFVKKFTEFENIKDLNEGVIIGGRWSTGREFAYRALQNTDLRLTLTEDLLIDASNFQRQWAA